MLQVYDLMTKEVFSLHNTDTLYLARSVMNMAKIRHVPIVDKNDKFIGLVTQRDILAATVSRLADIDQKTQDEIDAGIPIKEIMRIDVTTIKSDTSLKDAAKLLLEHKYGCLPVLDGKGRLIGILTEADFLSLTISMLEVLEKGPEEA